MDVQVKPEFEVPVDRGNEYSTTFICKLQGVEAYRVAGHVKKDVVESLRLDQMGIVAACYGDAKGLIDVWIASLAQVETPKREIDLDRKQFPSSIDVQGVVLSLVAEPPPKEE